MIDFKILMLVVGVAAFSIGALIENVVDYLRR